MSDDPFKDMDDAHRSRLSDQISQVAGELAEVAGSDVRRLEEFIFKEVFLPFFAGDEPEKRRYPQVGVGNWITYAGGAYKAVEVVDKAGTVLFTVPPIYDRNAVDSAQNSRTQSISHVVASAGQYANLSPRHAAQYLNAELTKRALIMKVPVNVLKHLEVWNQIFERYGRPALIKLDEEQSPNAAKDSSAPKDSGDEFDYTPL